MVKKITEKTDLIYRRVIIFVHIILVIAVLSSGSLAGLYFSQPFIHLVLKHPQDKVNIWHMKPGNNGSILTGGNFTTTIAFYNTSVFPITYEPQIVDVHYFPIGERPSCMFLYSLDNHFDPSSEIKNIPKVHKIIDSSSETFFKLNDLKVTLKSSRWDFTNPKYYEFKWNIGFEVPSDKLNTIKQIYMDCAKFEKVLFSLHLKENNLNYLFMNKKINTSFELLIPMNCSIDEFTHSLFYRIPLKKVPVLFDNLQHKTLNFS